MVLSYLQLIDMDTGVELKSKELTVRANHWELASSGSISNIHVFSYILAISEQFEACDDVHETCSKISKEHVLFS